MLVLKIHGLAMGYSGIRLETLKRLLWHFDSDVLPCVPSQGSVGASGKWSSMDIAEFNPKYDQDHRTAQLGASLIYRAIHQLDKYSSLGFKS